MLIQDHADAEPASSMEGAQMDIVGELDAFAVPEHWEAVHAALTGSTYRLEQDDTSTLFLLTGLDDSWDGTTVVAHVLVILEVDHPDRDAKIVVLSLVDEPTVPG